MMTQFLYLNLLLTVFLLVTLFESRLKQKHVPVSTLIVQRIHPLLLGTIILLFFFIILGLLLYASQLLVYWYVRGAFVVLIVGHALWLGKNRPIVTNTLLLLTSFTVLLLRFCFPSESSHNLLLLTSIVWIGPLLTNTGLLNTRRFVIISLFWFFYDIFFVWLTPASGELIDRTTTIGFPLAIIFDGSFIGTGDLLWASLFISILPKSKIQYIGIAVLVVSNILLGLYDYISGNESVFPLLVLWVPIGLLLLHLTGKFIINRRPGNNKNNDQCSNK